MDETIFQEPAKLHLTLCVMVLADEVERQLALDALKNCYDSVLRWATVFRWVDLVVCAILWHLLICLYENAWFGMVNCAFCF